MQLTLNPSIYARNSENYSRKTRHHTPQREAQTDRQSERDEVIALTRGHRATVYSRYILYAAARLHTYHPPALVRVKPNFWSLSMETLTSIIPSPCSVTTWPRITATRLCVTN